MLGVFRFSELQLGLSIITLVIKKLFLTNIPIITRCILLVLNNKKQHKFKMINKYYREFLVNIELNR